MITIVWQQKRNLKKILRTFNYPFKLKTVKKNVPTFRVTFEHQYSHSLKERITDWFEYWFSVIDSVFDYLITPKKKRHCILTPLEPIHFKRSCMPIDETLLELQLKANGYKIVEEYLRSASTAYDIIKV